MSSLQKTKLFYYKIQQVKLYETSCQFLTDLNVTEVEVCLQHKEVFQQKPPCLRSIFIRLICVIPYSSPSILKAQFKYRIYIYENMSGYTVFTKIENG